MSDEQPLRLQDLAEIDSPEVVRAAMRQFRKRVLVRGIWIVGLIAGIIFAAASFQPRDLPYRFRHGRAEIVGRTIDRPFQQITIMEVRRIDRRTVGVRLLATSDALRPGDTIYVREAGEKDPLTGAYHQRHEERRLQARGAGRLVEVWTVLDPGHPTFSLEFAILPLRPPANLRLSPAPGQQQGDPRLLARRTPGALVDTVAFDLRTFGLSDTIWR